MRTSRIGGTICWSLVLAVAAQSAIQAAEDDVRAKLETLMNRRAEELRFSGAVLVARDGVPLLRQASGMANRELGVLNSPETKFRIGSLTKQFTAAAVLVLQQANKLEIHEKLSLYLPDCPDAWKPITIEHLLTHTAGIPNYTSFPDYPKTMREPTTPDLLIGRFRDRPLEFVPGEKFAYSNSGYAVLGRVIERVSGRSYREFLQAAIFTPLAMNDSGYDEAPPVLPHRAAGYSKQSDRVENAPYLDMSIPYSAGALYSTVDDLLKWDRALAGSELLSRTSRDAMFTPFRERYGYGWTIVKRADRVMVAHSGGINGFVSHIRRFPEERVCIVVLSNIEQTPVAKLADELTDVVLPAPSEAGARPDTKKPDVDQGKPAGNEAKPTSPE